MKVRYIHGDVILERFDDKLPKGLKEKKDKIIRSGEFSGHHHRLGSGGKIMVKDNFMFVIVDNPAKITHEEHKTIEIAPGVYKIRDEVEYDYFAEETKKVLD